MPEIGEIKTDRELGLKGKHRRKWVICPQCGEGRWVILTATKRPGYTGLCHQCNASVRGGKRLKTNGRWITGQGYVMRLLQPDDFFFSMTGADGYVGEHRLVMAQSLGRSLHSWEIVHHKGTRYPTGSKENRGDNRIENLQLVSDDKHKQISILEAKITRLQKKLHTTNFYYLREIQRQAEQLKLADKNYLELKNEFDERIEEAQYIAWQTGIRWVGLTFAKNMTLKEIMETDFWSTSIRESNWSDSNARRRVYND